MQKFIILFFAATLSLLTSCTRTDMAVRWADTFISWELNSQFDLSSDQKKIVRGQVDEGLVELRKQMFPKYSEFLAKTQKEFSSLPENNKEKALALMKLKGQEVDELFQASLVAITPEIMKSSEQLNEKNWASFKEEFADKNKDILRKSKKESSTLISRFKEWLGPLTFDQEKMVIAFTEANPFPTELRVKNREHLFATFEKKSGLNEKMDKAKVQESLKLWLKSYRQDQLPDYKQALETYQNKFYDFLSELYLVLSPAQKKVFLENLQTRSEDFARLKM